MAEGQHFSGVTVLEKRLVLSADLYTILQALSLTLFEKTPIFKLFAETDYMLSKCCGLSFLYCDRKPILEPIETQS